MRPDEANRAATAVGSAAVGVQVLAGGFSHETCLLTLDDGQVVVRLGGAAPAVEAAVMEAGRRHVPVPQVLGVLPADGDVRAAMVLECVTGTPLSEVLDGGGLDHAELRELAAVDGHARLVHSDLNPMNILVTRPLGHPIADRAARKIREWIAGGWPGTARDS